MLAQRRPRPKRHKAYFTHNHANKQVVLRKVASRVEEDGWVEVEFRSRRNGTTPPISFCAPSVDDIDQLIEILRRQAQILRAHLGKS